MIFRTTSKLRPIYRISSRNFGLQLENCTLPYRFGNTQTLGRPFTKEPISYLFRKGMEVTPDTMKGIQFAYRGLLSTIQQQDLRTLDTMVEKKLYESFKKGMDGMMGMGYNFLLHNQDADIKVHIKDVGLIVGGLIDRRKEYQNNLRLAKLPLLKVIAYADNLREALNKNLLLKIYAEVRTTCKLDLKSGGGDTFLKEAELNKEEVHEITIEGYSKNLIKLLEVSPSKLAEDVFKIEKATIVDFDNVLKGNCHKDCSYL